MCSSRVPPPAVGRDLRCARLRPRVELEVASEAGFESRAGQEYPVNGLRVIHVSVPAIDSDILQTYNLNNLSLVLSALWLRRTAH